MKRRFQGACVQVYSCWNRLHQTGTDLLTSPGMRGPEHPAGTDLEKQEAKNVAKEMIFIFTVRSKLYNGTGLDGESIRAARAASYPRRHTNLTDMRSIFKKIASFGQQIKYCVLTIFKTGVVLMSILIQKREHEIPSVQIDQLC